MFITVNKKIFRNSYKIINDFLTDTDKKTIPCTFIAQGNVLCLVTKKEDMTIFCKVEEAFINKPGKVALSLIDFKPFYSKIKDKEIFYINTEKEVEIGRVEYDIFNEFGTMEISEPTVATYPKDLNLIATLDRLTLYNSLKETGCIIKNNPEGIQEYLRYLNVKISRSDINLYATDNYRIISKYILTQSNKEDDFCIESPIINSLTKFLGLLKDVNVSIYTNEKFLTVVTDNIKAVFPINREVKTLSLKKILDLYSGTQEINVYDYLDELESFKNSLPRHVGNKKVEKNGIEDLMAIIDNYKVKSIIHYENKDEIEGYKVNFKYFLNILTSLCMEDIIVNNPTGLEPLVIEYKKEEGEMYKVLILPSK